MKNKSRALDDSVMLNLKKGTCFNASTTRNENIYRTINERVQTEKRSIISYLYYVVTYSLPVPNSYLSSTDPKDIIIEIILSIAKALLLSSG